MLSNDDSWIADLMIQQIVSPVWRQHTENFKDSFCVYFDPQLFSDEAQLLQIHQEFKQLINLLVVDISVQTQVEESRLMLNVHKQNTKQPHKVFQDFELVSSFDVFQQMMKLRNKDIENEAHQANKNKNITAQYTTSQVYQDQFKDSERFELERLKKQALLKQLEDDELRRAMQLSQEDYDAYLRSLRNMEEDDLQRALRLSMEYMTIQKQSEFSSIISYQSIVQRREEGVTQDEIRSQFVQSNGKMHTSLDEKRSLVIAQREEILSRKRDIRNQESAQFKLINPSHYQSNVANQKSETKYQTAVQQSYSNNDYNPYQSLKPSVQETTQQGSVLLDKEAVKKRNTILNKLKSQVTKKEQ